MTRLITFIHGKWLSICTTWLGVYPILTVIAWVMEPYLSGLPVAARSLVMSLLMVPVMVLVIMPLMQRLTGALTKRPGFSGASDSTSTDTNLED